MIVLRDSCFHRCMEQEKVSCNCRTVLAKSVVQPEYLSDYAGMTWHNSLTTLRHKSCPESMLKDIKLYFPFFVDMQTYTHLTHKEIQQPLNGEEMCEFHRPC